MEEHLDFLRLGYDIPAAPSGEWRSYDPDDPQPGYYQFDWLSSRYPDLYHAFALSTDGLMSELATVVDLSGLNVVDIGAGTGRSAIGAAKTARYVYAIDAFRSVVDFGSRLVREMGLTNVEYMVGDRSQLPFRDDHVDAAICSWALMDYDEACRVVKTGGWVVHMGGADGPDELTPVLAPDYPHLVPQTWDPELLTADRPAEDFTIGTTKVHEFTYTADFGDPDEAVAIFGRLFGPNAAAYLHERGGSTVWSRQRIYYGRVAK